MKQVRHNAAQAKATVFVERTARVAMHCRGFAGERSRCFGRAAQAFTLLELLIAVVVFAIVLLAINVVFYSALKLRNKSAEALDKLAPLQRALTLMKMDIANIVPPGGTLSGSLQSPLMGLSPASSSYSTAGSSAGSAGSASSMLTTMPLVDAIESSPFFYTTTGSIDDNLPWPDIQQVSYILTESTNGAPGKDLVRCVTRNLLPADVPEYPSRERLLSGVETFAFLYYDGLQWQTYWDSTQMTNSLPLAIKVLIQLTGSEKRVTPPAPIELVVPIYVQSQTNQASQTNQTAQSST